MKEGDRCRHREKQNMCESDSVTHRQRPEQKLKEKQEPLESLRERGAGKVPWGGRGRGAGQGPSFWGDRDVPGFDRVTIAQPTYTLPATELRV